MGKSSSHSHDPVVRRLVETGLLAPMLLDSPSLMAADTAAVKTLSRGEDSRVEDHRVSATWIGLMAHQTTSLTNLRSATVEHGFVSQVARDGFTAGSLDESKVVLVRERPVTAVFSTARAELKQLA